MASVIESGDYQQRRDALKKDPIIQAMADEIIEDVKDGGTQISEITHEDGHATFSFMQNCNDEYYQVREGKIGRSHIGAVSEAVLQLIKEKTSGEEAERG